MDVEVRVMLATTDVTAEHNETATSRPLSLPGKTSTSTAAGRVKLATTPATSRRCARYSTKQQQKCRQKGQSGGTYRHGEEVRDDPPRDCESDELPHEGKRWPKKEYRHNTAEAGASEIQFVFDNPQRRGGGAATRQRRAGHASSLPGKTQRPRRRSGTRTWT